MVFSGFNFIFLALPLMAALYFLIPRRAVSLRNGALLILGLLFYCCAGVRYLPLLILSALLNYALALPAAPGNRGSKAAVILCVVLNAAILGVFKYALFAVETANALGASLPLPQIALPLGVSFYTFKGMSYVFDVRAGRLAPEKNFFRVLLYVSFFPQVTSGPIGRYTDFAPRLGERRVTADAAARGLTRFCFGLAKKLIIADALALIADAMYLSPSLTVSFAWLGAVSYSLQLYFDFSGYSDMAIGIAQLFGFYTPENFNYPYVSSSVAEFWRRWHMSLSFWFRDYVYIPMGGSRCSRPRQALNILVVWSLTGLWHGADWTFVLWGLYYALLLMGSRFIWGRLYEKLPRLIRIAVTFAAVTVGWVLFRAPDAAAALRVISAMFGAAPLSDGQSVYYLLENAPVLALAFIAALPVKPALEKALAARQERPLARFLLVWAPKILALGLLALSYITMLGSTYKSFIYFNF